MRLLTGASGMIGRNLVDLLPPMLTPTHKELDLTSTDKVREYLNANKPEMIIHCASNDGEICLKENLEMFVNLAESKIPMITFCTGLEIENRPNKSGEYVLSKYITRELALSKYNHITVIKIWGCFGKYEKDSRFFTDNILRIKAGLPIIVRENKFFSYVYVKDLAALMIPILWGRPVPIVAYTETLLDYAKILKEVSGSPHDIIVQGENFYRSYVGKNEIPYNFTPLKTAIKELHDFYNHPLL